MSDKFVWDSGYYLDEETDEDRARFDAIQAAIEQTKEHFDPAQSRYPKGSPLGGQWKGKGGGLTVGSAADGGIYGKRQGALSELNARITTLEDEGNDSPDNHEYAALAHAATAIDADLNTRPSQKAGTQAFYAFDGEHCVGAAWVRGDKKTKILELEQLGSLQKGAGSALINQAANWGRNNGYTKMRLSSSAGARSFYEQAGFVNKGGNVYEGSLVE